LRAGLAHGSLLDVGAGIGALTFELLDRGMSSAVVIEASSAYAAAVQEEAGRRDRTAAIQIQRGDFVDLSVEVSPAAVVSLDRVVCCYTGYERLLDDAVRHSHNGLAISYPKNRWYVRVVIWFDNAKRARKSGFRTFVHPPTQMRRLIESHGFELVGRTST